MPIGTIVTIRPEWQDAGDAGRLYITTDAADKGRVTIAPLDWPWAIVPTQTVTLGMIRAMA